MTATGTVRQAVNYTVGQCTWFVSQLFGWVGNWGNAGQWLARAQAAGEPTSSTPVVGSIAVWGGGLGGADAVGHVAAVTAIQPNGLPVVEEMNYTYGPGRADMRVVDRASAAGIIGYILPPGGESSSGGGIVSSIGDVAGGVGSAVSGVTSGILGGPASGVAAGVAAGVASGIAEGFFGLFGAAFTDLGVFLKRQGVALAVAAAVLLVLFSGRDQQSAPS